MTLADDVTATMTVTWANGEVADPVTIPFPTILAELRQARAEVTKEVRTIKGVTFTLKVGDPE